jgi:hypothetical protein
VHLKQPFNTGKAIHSSERMLHKGLLGNEKDLAVRLKELGAKAN